MTRISNKKRLKMSAEGINWTRSIKNNWKIIAESSIFVSSSWKRKHSSRTSKQPWMKRKPAILSSKRRPTTLARWEKKFVKNSKLQEASAHSRRPSTSTISSWWTKITSERSRGRLNTRTSSNNSMRRWSKRTTGISAMWSGQRASCSDTKQKSKWLTLKNSIQISGRRKSWESKPWRTFGPRLKTQLVFSFPKRSRRCTRISRSKKRRNRSDKNNWKFCRSSWRTRSPDKEKGRTSTGSRSTGREFRTESLNSKAQWIRRNCYITNRISKLSKKESQFWNRLFRASTLSSSRIVNSASLRLYQRTPSGKKARPPYKLDHRIQTSWSETILVLDLHLLSQMFSFRI